MFLKYAKLQILNVASFNKDFEKKSSMEDVVLYSPKTAFIKHDISENLIMAKNALDIVSELEQRDPEEWIVFRSRAIDAGGSEETGEIWHGANDNGDFFSEEELLKSYSSTEDGKEIKSFETFINCPIFTNHQNTDIEKARGKVINAFYDKDNHCVYTDALVDAKAYPELARGIREGYISDVSMGASVKFSDCSICNHRATNEKEYCVVPGTYIETENHTIKPIEDIEIGDKVLTQDGTYQSVLDIHEREIEDEIFEIYASGNNVPLEITGNHEVLTIPKMSYRMTFEQYIQRNDLKPVYKRTDELNIGDFVLYPKENLRKSENPLKSLRFARLLGLFISEGNLFRNKKGEINALEFHLSLEEKDLLEDLLNLIKEFAVREAKVYKKTSTYHIRIWDKDLAEKVVSLCGHGARTKSLSKEIINASGEFKINLLGGIIDGDGWVDPKDYRSVIVTSSDNLSYQIKKISQDLGFSCSIYKTLNTQNETVKYSSGEPNTINHVRFGSHATSIIKQGKCKKLEKLNCQEFEKATSSWIFDNYHVSKIRKISKKYYSGTVMNLAVENNENYIANGMIVHNCSHVKNHKGKKLGGKEVYEINHGIKFIELSAVTDGACDNCTIQNSYTGMEFLDKLKNMISASHSNAVALKKVAMFKGSAGDDIDKLNKSLDLLKGVAETILNSKDVDFEFLEDIGQLLAELQSLIVDLVEAGFANQNPAGETQGEGTQQQAADALTGGEEVPANQGAPPTGDNQSQGLMSPTSPVSLGGKEQNIKTANLLEGLKTQVPEIKKILASINNLKNQITFDGDEEMATSKNIKRKLASNRISEKFSEILESQVSNNEPAIISDGPYSVKIDFNKGIQGFVGNNRVIAMTVEEVGDDLLGLAKVNPSVIGGRLIEKLASKYDENGEVKMSKQAKDLNIKEAFIENPPPVEQVQEGQLEDLSGNFDRKNHPELAEGQIGATTQKQLENVPKSKETGKGDWNRVRPEGTKEDRYVQEIELDRQRPTDYGSERASSGAAKAEGQHSGTQESQLQMSLNYGSERWIDDAAPCDYLPTTEGQFSGKDRKGKAVDEVYEGQLTGHRQGNDSEVSSESFPHTASVEDYIAGKVVTAIKNGLTNLVMEHGISPKTIVNSKIDSKKIASGNRNKILKKAQLAQVDVQNLAENEIIDQIGPNMDLAEDYLDDAIVVLFEDPAELEAELRNYTKERLAKIQEVSDKEDSDETVESKRRKALKEKAFKRNANRVSMPVDAQKLTELFPGVSDFTGLDAKLVKQKFLQSQPGAKLLDFRKVDGGFVAEVELPEQSGEESGNSINSNGVPSPSIPSNNAPSHDSQSAQSAQSDQSVESTVEVAAETVDKLKAFAKQKKEAQSPAGTTMPPPQGGAAGGGAAGDPMGGGGAQDLFGNTPEGAGDVIDETEDDMEDEVGEAKPFGSFNPFTGNENVDVVDGHYRDSDTGLEWEVQMNINVLNPEKIDDIQFKENTDADSELTEGEDINEEIAGQPNAAPMGAPAGGGAAADPMGMGAGPMASYPGWVKDAPLKLAMKASPEYFLNEKMKSDLNIKTASKPVGSICPQCASHKVAFRNSEGNCASCGCKTYVTAKKNKAGSLDVDLYMLPNLKRAEKENRFGGHAVTANVENKEVVEKAIHQILSDRRALVKAASILEKDPMLACISEQSVRGFDSEDSIQICASIKSYLTKQAQFEEEDDEEDDNSEETSSPTVHDSDSEVTDSVEFEDEIDESGDSEGLEEVEEESDTVEDTDDSDLEEVFEDESGEEGDDFSLNLQFTDSDGKSGSINITEDGVDVNGDVFEGAESTDDFGSDIAEDGEEMFEDEMGEEAPEEIEITEIVETEDDDPSSLDGLFSSSVDKLDRETEESEGPSEESEDEFDVMANSLNTSELLRGSRVASSNRSGGSSLDLGFLKAALQSVPTDTGADVPRSEEHGVRDEGGNVHTTKNENSAKKRNSIADTSFNEKGVANGSDRGVEQIKPQTGKHAGSADDFIVTAGEDNKEKGKRKDVCPDDFADKQCPGKGKDKSNKPYKGGEKVESCNAGSEKKKVQAQTAPTQQLEPVDAIEEGKEESNGEKFDIPRDKSKSNPEINVKRKDVTSPTKVRNSDYGFGQKAKDLHTEVVPRDSSGDGLGGPSTTFEDEVAENRTSGSPDTYVQEYQKQNQIKPTPAGNAENHATASKEVCIKIAKANDLNANRLEAINFGSFYVVRDLDSGRTFKYSE